MTEKCYLCNVWAEPPFKKKVVFENLASLEDLSRLLRGEDCVFVTISRPLCRYCAHATLYGDDGLTEEGKDALDLSEEA